MPTQRLIVHPFGSPLDSTSAPTLIPADGIAQADNAEYVLSTREGKVSYSLRKRLGTARYNSVATGADEVFTALDEFWRHGTSLSPTQKFVACVEDKIVKDDLDGTWDNLIASGWGSNTARSSITIAQGYAVFSNNENDTPQKWDQTTISDLTASGLPKFEACVYHLRRLFTIGEQTPLSGSANPSRTTYSAAGDITDFTGADAGNIIFDEDDGDRLIGVSQSFLSSLYYFKGPNKGSIHELSGLTPTTFTRKPLFQAAPCISHESIITTTNDVYWASQYGFHSLRATEKFGNTEAFYLSRPIQRDFLQLNRSRMDLARGFHHPTRNIVGWLVPTGSATVCDTAFVYNYAIGGWSIWMFSGLFAGSAMVALTPVTRIPRLYLGGTEGYVYKGDQSILSDENANLAYTYRLKSPAHVTMPGKTLLDEVSLQSLTTVVRPTGTHTCTVQVTVDGRVQTYSVNLGLSDSGDLLDSTFVMDASTLATEAETSIIETTIEDIGRVVQVIYSQAGADEDVEVAGYALRYNVGETESKESV